MERTVLICDVCGYARSANLAVDYGCPYSIDPEIPFRHNCACPCHSEAGREAGMLHFSPCCNPDDAIAEGCLSRHGFRLDDDKITRPVKAELSDSERERLQTEYHKMFQ